MGMVKAIYPTMQEARAFSKGVEYVNDSAISLIGIEKGERGWIASFEDEDFPIDADRVLDYTGRKGGVILSGTK